MNKYTKEQKEWCEQYEKVTTFEPLMGGFESGEETFAKAAKKA